MDIIIKDTNITETIINKSKVVWKNFKGDYLRSIVIQYVAGIGILISTIMSDHHVTKISEVNSSNWWNFDFLPALGIVVITMATIKLYGLFRSRSLFYSKIKKLARKYSSGSNELIIQITDNGVRLQSDDYVSEIKWTYFSTYALTSNILFLNTDDSPTASSVSVEKKMISEKDFSALLGFVKSKLPVSKGEVSNAIPY